ncbi:S-layer homology domain-containing protein [Chengkuizengella sediminis]|uniref:S-layer homology domain-containing protein n=1 Tax=Chengkuizengella sediminis TaxID=1885917 RepID=UPI00138A3E97|nr:S-layer homology domain-containing protein [Chengkuizengella sediminis]NDI34851.1 hypothetical protein [Chengkuizengella sediminis]
MRNSNRYILVPLLSFLLIFSSVVPLVNVQAQGEIIEEVVGESLNQEVFENEIEALNTYILGNITFYLPDGFESYILFNRGTIYRANESGADWEWFSTLEQLEDINIESNESYFLEMAFTIRNAAHENIIFLYQANLTGQEIIDLDEINIDESEVTELQIESNDDFINHRLTVIPDSIFTFNINEFQFNESGVTLWLPTDMSEVHLKYIAKKEIDENKLQRIHLSKKINLNEFQSPINFDNELGEAVKVSFLKNGQPLEISSLLIEDYLASSYTYFEENTILMTPDSVKFEIYVGEGDYEWIWVQKIDVMEDTDLYLTDSVDLDVSFGYFPEEVRFEHQLMSGEFNLQNVIFSNNGESESAISYNIEIKNVNKEIVFMGPAETRYEFLYSNLTPGNYEYNVTINLPNQEPIQKSEWFEIDTWGTSSPPTNLEVIASEGEVELTWESNLNSNAPTGHVVKRSESKGGPFIDIAEMDKSEMIINAEGNIGTTHFIDSDVIDGITYYYIVTALNDVGEGIPSNEVSVTLKDKEDDGDDGNSGGTTPPSGGNSGGNSDGGTPSGGTGSTSPSGGTPPPQVDEEELESTEQQEESNEPKSVEVDVNDVKTEDQSDGTIKTIVEVDDKTITKALKKAEEVDQLIIDLSTVETDTVDIQLSSESINAVTDNNDETVIEIVTDEVAYRLPVEEIDLDDTAKKLGVSSDELEISIQINKLKDTNLTEEQNELDLASDVYDFHIEVSSGDETIEVEHFGQYVERVIIGEKRFDPNRSIAVRLNEDGTFSPIPTIFDGNEAIIKSNSNSMYVIVENKVTFEDSEGWYQTTIEKLASKYIVNGVSETKFAPNEVTTRAQLAAMLVRSLDLKSNKNYSSIFTDVEGTEWFVNELNAAVEAGIIKGYNDNTFKPSDLITREQAATMIYRAMELVRFDESKLNQSLIAKNKFSDYAEISDWAKEELEVMTQTGIIGGKTENTIAPSANATRAEVAVMIARFLQFVDFMD